MPLLASQWVLRIRATAGAATPDKAMRTEFASGGQHFGQVSLEQFLVERYCLYALRRGRLVCADVAHEPWRLAAVDLELQQCDMTRLAGVEVQGAPVSALAALPLDVAGWSPRPC